MTGKAKRKYNTTFGVHERNKRAQMALNRSPEFKNVIVRIVCATEIQFELA